MQAAAALVATSLKEQRERVLSDLAPPPPPTDPRRRRQTERFSTDHGHSPAPAAPPQPDFPSWTAITSSPPPAPTPDFNSGGGGDFGGGGASGSWD